MEAHRRRPDAIGVAIGFNDREARRIFAGSDFTLMPSRFEPCGLSQMYAQRFGSLPIGHQTGGLAETMDESIRYAIRTPHDGAEMTPCVLAGPTCDSADVMYEKLPYPLPVTLEIGDKVLIEGTGAYTSTYSSVAFNGIPPLKTYHI